MSQFSYKYYRHNYVRNEKNKASMFDDESWTFWRVWGWYEWLSILALLAIVLLLSLLFFGGLHMGGAKVSSNAALAPSSYVPASTIVSPKRQVAATVPENVLVTAESNKVATPALPKGAKPLYHYTKKVLPASVLPLQRTEYNGQTAYGPVSIEEYMYFIRETAVTYPDFIDAKTDNLIEAKAPKCYMPECTIYNIQNLHKRFYAQWLSQASGKKLMPVLERDDIVLIETSCEKAQP